MHSQIIGVMKKALSAASLTAILLACGDDGTQLVLSGMEDAGEVLEDAGEMLQDAAAALSDAGEASAQDAAPEPPKGPTVVEASCDIERTVSGGTVEKWAKVEAELSEVRSVWACGACTVQVCKDTEIPAPECSPPAYHYAKGAVWVMCGPNTTARVVLQ